MIRSFLIIATALLVLGGCEKAGSIFGSGTRVEAGKVLIPGGKVDESMDALVLRDGEAVMFRHDLPFPKQLEIRMRVLVDYDGVQKVVTSALGAESTRVDRKIETDMRYLKGPGSFDIQFEKTGTSLLEGEELGEVAAELLRGKELEGQSIRFVLSEHGWRRNREAGPVDFKLAVWADGLRDQVPQVLVESGAHPRVNWFSSSRAWRKDDRLVLAGSSLKILDPFDVSGRVVLKFEGLEAIGGHPCGVFSLNGSLDVRDQLQVDGSTRRADISITSGKIWASLLYPVLLREEYETIQTVEEGTFRGGAVSKWQGGMTLTKARNWVILES